MSHADLWFESGEASLSVVEFVIREALSKPFEVTVIARSSNDDLDLDALVGAQASLRAQNALAVPAASVTAQSRHLRGVCVAAELVQVESDGLSTYEIVIAPKLSLLQHRVRYRIFQHQSIPEIAINLFREWGIDANVAFDEGGYPKLEYRVQFAESDFSFVSRLLEEAGISYAFPSDDPKGPEMLLEDSADANQPQIALHYLENAPIDLRTPHISKVRVGRKLQTGRVVISDHSFRLHTTTQLRGEAVAKGRQHASANVLERHEHVVGASVVEVGTPPGDSPAGDTRGAARSVAKTLDIRAERTLDAERAERKHVSFETNVFELRPGLCFRIEAHPRRELRADKLLVIELETRGSVTAAWHIAGRALFADQPYKPARKTPRPRVHGIETAVVVGATNLADADYEDIHTDEFGRVRVQFAWDHTGELDERSSCWLRVSQAWAGGGHSAFALPRVGDEVIVGFFDGNPDQPVVIGRLHNATSPVPYALPAGKTITGIRTASTPGTGGFNELRFDDAAGNELVFVQAERDYTKLVKNDEAVTVCAARVLHVGQTDDSTAAQRHSITIAPLEGATEGPVTRIETTPGKIVFTTGEASLTIEGPNVTIEASGQLIFRAKELVRMESIEDDVIIQGGPLVRINPRGAGEAPEDAIPLDLPVGETPSGFTEEIAAASDHASFDPANPTFFDDATGPGGVFDPAAPADSDEKAAFGAFKYAVAGRAIGMPEGVLLRRAGARNLEANGAGAGTGTPGNGLWGGEAPYGNSESSYAAMQKGFAFHTAQYS